VTTKAVTGPPAYEATINAIGDATAARMASSWRPGCPVSLADLRFLTLTYWGYDGVAHRGELVVHAEQATRVVDAFRALFDSRFPIERMELVDAYGGDDHASTLANNTAAFNCRAVVGNPGSWSEHAYGRAIDVNPRVNPYLLDPHVRDPELAPYIDRSVDDPGMIRPGDAAVQAFAAQGWQWGGAWSPTDYQHFSATGR
jgi:poly-gamma-glutamate synthesis protein (capsule biosynthesis protein)